MISCNSNNLRNPRWGYTCYYCYHHLLFCCMDASLFLHCHPYTLQRFKWSLHLLHFPLYITDKPSLLTSPSHSVLLELVSFWHVVCWKGKCWFIFCKSVFVWAPPPSTSMHLSPTFLWNVESTCKNRKWLPTNTGSTCVSFMVAQFNCIRRTIRPFQVASQFLVKVFPSKQVGWQAICHYTVARFPRHVVRSFWSSAHSHDCVCFWCLYTQRVIRPLQWFNIC